MIELDTIANRAIFSGVLLGIFTFTLAIVGQVHLKYVQWRTRHKEWPAEVWKDKPALLVFSTDECVVCKFQQAKEIEAIRKDFSEDQLDIRKFNATKEPKIATLLGVVNVPSTVIINGNGEITTFNTGLAKEKQLLEQLKSVVS